MRKEAILERKLNVLHYIREKSADGIPPSVREICKAMNIKSTSTVYSILCALEEDGFIERDSRNSRAIRLAGASPVEQVPVLGRVTAGLPVLAVENIEGYIPVSKAHSGRELFALRVSGYSMKNAGIMDGDYVISDSNSAIFSGDIVVALIEDEATVKRYVPLSGGMVRLQPENEDFEPLEVMQPTIIGRIVSLVRNY